MEKEIKEKILSELKEWDCIKDEYDALGITEQIMKIIKPLITENDSKRGPEGTDINKVFGKMPEARELLENKPKEKGRLEKIIQSIYDAGYYNGKMGRDKDNFNINKAIKEIETALNPQSDSKRAQIPSDEDIKHWESIHKKWEPRV